MCCHLKIQSSCSHFEPDVWYFIFLLLLYLVDLVIFTTSTFYPKLHGWSHWTTFSLMPRWTPLSGSCFSITINSHKSIKVQYTHVSLIVATFYTVRRSAGSGLRIPARPTSTEKWVGFCPRAARAATAGAERRAKTLVACDVICFLEMSILNVGLLRIWPWCIIFVSLVGIFLFISLSCYALFISASRCSQCH